jgi:peptidoglycan DL-endopeptidase CwlO
MLLDVFVRASGAAMGLARDSFGLNVGLGAGVGSASGPAPMLAAAVSGSGRAAGAFNSASNVVDGQVSALGEQDLAANSGLAGALAAAGAGRDQMDAVIAAALADITRLAAATSTPAGQQALVNALTLRLEQTWQVLTNGGADASTRAASSAQVAAAYSGVGSYPVGGLAATSPMATMAPMGAMSPMAALSPMQGMPMLSAQTMAANQAAVSEATQLASMQQLAASTTSNPSNSTDKTATLTSAIGATTDAGEINTVIQRAMKELGVPYSWGGGGAAGPSRGIGSGANTVGFDCSGLVQYAFWPYVHLPRDTYGQINVGTTVSPSGIQAGDLIFSYFGEGGIPGPGHVQLAISHTQVVEAPYTGADVRVTGVAPGQIVVKRILG